MTEAFRKLTALGSTVVVGAGDERLLDAVVAVVMDEVQACDLACSRFRADSELERLNDASVIRSASGWLLDAVETALQVAEWTHGLVDPTVGQTLIDLGYDRTFEQLEPENPPVLNLTHSPAWRSIFVDPANRIVQKPAGVRLDLGATAKALCSDRAAHRAAAETSTGVLVSLGGDIAVAGDAPEHGWSIRVTDRSDTDPSSELPGQTVSVRVGGLATSGTASRRWVRGGASVHHLIDPRSGAPAAEVWRTVTVAAPTCVEANAASTAAVVLGPQAEAWLAERGFDARLVGVDGSVRTAGRWPAEDGTQVRA